MKKNMGPRDRLIRYLIAFALLAAGVFAPLAAGWRTFLLVLGGIEMISVAVSY